MNKSLSDQDIAVALQTKAESIKFEIDQLTNKIDQLEEDLYKIETALEVYAPSANVPESPVTDRSKFTLAQRIEHVLRSNNLPLTSSECLKAINEAFPDKTMVFTSFSPQLSTIVKDVNKPFQRIEFPNNPNETRHFYGLKDWFDGDRLKDLYLERLKKKNKANATMNLSTSTS